MSERSPALNTTQKRPALGASLQSRAHGKGSSLSEESPPVPVRALVDDREVVIAEGHAVEDVATRRGISTRTLETYRSRAMDQFGPKTRADIVRPALLRCWLRSE